MSKTKTAADTLFAEVRNGMLEEIPVCRTCGQTTVKIAPIARLIGITSPTLTAYVLDGKPVSQGVFGKIVNFLARRRAEREAGDVAEATA